MLEFLSEAVEDGISERRFDLTVAEDTVPGLLWTPADATGPRPLILIGHGGIQHKRIELILDLARRFAGELGYAAAAIDAPEHGDRISREDRIRQREERARWLRDGSLEAHVQRVREMRDRNRVAVAEWQATLDALQMLPEVGATGPAGYWGVSMATVVGIPLLAAEPRITAAVLGLSGLHFGSDEIAPLARQISIPLLFLLQWHDELIPRQGALDLFDAFASPEKTMHVNPGPHLPVLPHERAASVAFFARHFGSA